MLLSVLSIALRAPRPRPATVVRTRRACASAASSSNNQQEYAAGLAFDLETTGLNIHTSEIVQLAVVISNSRRVPLPCFSALVMPEGAIDPGASAVHGFTRKVLRERGAEPFDRVWAKCENWLNSTLGETRPLVWAAHNGDSFDRPILCRAVRERAARMGVVESELLNAPRSSWVDTLRMSRRALPRRASPCADLGPHTLGSLYYTASGGKLLQGAHDALADAEALSTVWRWLVESGAEPESTKWPGAGSSLDDDQFQAHLQWHGYALGEGEKERQSNPTGRRSRSATSKRKAVARSDESMTRVAGIGPDMERRLSGKGLTTYAELEAAWHQHGRSHRRMLGWLRKSMPGANNLVLAKAVKGMHEEWG